MRTAGTQRLQFTAKQCADVKVCQGVWSTAWTHSSHLSHANDTTGTQNLLAWLFTKIELWWIQKDSWLEKMFLTLQVSQHLQIREAAFFFASFVPWRKQVLSLSPSPSHGEMSRKLRAEIHWVSSALHVFFPCRGEWGLLIPPQLWAIWVMKGTHLLVQDLVFIDATHFSPGLALCGEGTQTFQNTFYNQVISRFMQYNTFNR